jgi:hypothetical protein
VQIFRIRCAAGTPLFFQFFTEDTFGRAHFLALGQVPHFHGESAWFEVELLARWPWPTWRVGPRALPRW